MKTYRPLVVLFVFLCGLATFAQDSSEFTSLKAKAVKGNGIAQYNLGLAYVEGKGTAVDPIEGFVWLSLARENGARGRALDNLVSSFDRATYASAQKRLAERKAELGLKPAAVTGTPAPATVEPPVAPEPKPAPAAPAQVQPAVPSDDAALARLRSERDALAAQVSELAGNLAALRAERERLAKLAGDSEKSAREAAEARAELGRTRQSLAALQSAPKPAADTSALDRKTRELQAALTELEAARNFGSQVESTLNKVTDQKTALEGQLTGTTNEANRTRQEAAALAKARDEAQQTLNAITAEHTVLQAEVAQLRSRPAAPSYPDLSGRVRELESSLTETQRQLAAKPAAPRYPDLSGRVSELESALAAARQPAAPRYPDLSGRVRELESNLTDQSAEVARAKKEIATLAQAKEEAQRQLAAKPAAPSYPDLSGKVTELEAQVSSNLSAAASAQAEAARAKQGVTTLTKARDDAQRQLAAKPAVPAWPDLRGDVAAMEDKLAQAQRVLVALQAARAEVEAARNFGRQVEVTLNKVSDQKTALEGQLAGATGEANRARQEAAAVAKARDEAQQQLGAIRAEHTVLQSELAQLRSRPSIPAGPDLSGKVGELETALAETNRQLIAAQAVAAKAAAPTHPDLSAKVGELEAALAASTQKAGATEQARAEIAKQFDDYKSATIAAQRDRTTMVAQVKMLESDKVALRRQVDAATAETGQLRTQVAGLKIQQAAIKPTAPTYPDLSGKVGELEARLAAAEKSATEKPLAPAYPDLSSRVRELEAQVAAKPTAPAYPDLSGRVSELEGQLARPRQPAAPKYPDLSGRVSELEASLADVSAAAARARQEVATSAKAKEDAQAQVTSLTAERDSARNAQKELRDTIAKLAQDKAQLTAASNAAPAYPDLRDRVARLESDLATAGTNSRQSAAVLGAANEQISLLKSALAAKPAAPNYPDLSGRVSELEAALAARPAAPAYPDLSGKVGTLEAQVAALTRAREEKPAAPDLSGRVADLTGEVAQLRADRERMQKMLADAGRQMRDATAAASRIKELETQVTGLQGSLAARGEAPAYPDLSAKVGELEAKLAAAEKSAAEKPGAPAYPDLSGRVGELEAAQAGLRQQLAEASSALQNAAKGGDDSAKLRREREELTGRVSELAGEVAQLRTDRERMQKMLADAGRQLRDSTADASRLKDLETQLVAAQTQAGGLATERDVARNAQGELRERVASLESDLTAARSAANRLAVPAYPDLSGRVRELESQVASLANAPRGRAPAYPDLSGRVSELEAALAEARQRPAVAATPDTTGTDNSELQKKLADTEDRLTTALRGYALLEKDRDALAANARKATDAVTTERDALAAQVTALSGEVAQLRAGAQSSAGSTQAEITRLNEALAALQRSTAQNTTDLASTRALAQQLQGANAVLAGENYQLKTRLSRTPGSPGTVAAAPAAAPASRTHVVASGDSLSRLSQRYYGTAGRWQEIYSANMDRIGANGLLRIGTQLRIP